MSTPSWADAGGSATPSSTTSFTATTNSDVERPDTTTLEPQASTKTSTTTSGTSSRCSCTRPWCLYSTILTSLALCGIFAYSSSTQFNDKNGIAWFIYYVVLAILCFAYVVHRLCCQILTKSIMGLTVIMFIYSSVLLGISASQFAKSNKGGETGGGDWDGKTEKEEKAYEVAGSSLGLVTCIMYLILLMCCGTTPNNKKNDGSMEKDAGLN